MRLLFFVISLLMATTSFCAKAATYYVSNTGKDSNSGTSKASPWASLAKVNATVFTPGDSILLEGGVTFSGGIYFDASVKGTASKPIVISSYGTGKAIINSGTSFGLYIYNSAGYKIESLVFQGSGRESNTKSGIEFYMDLPNAKLPYIAIENVEVFGFKESGIRIGSWNGTSGYESVSITNCSAHDNGDSGIITYAYNSMLGHRNVYVGNCKVYNNSGLPQKTTSHSGNGIVLGGVDGGIIEYCEAYNNGWLNAWANGGPVGIWGYVCNNLIIQYNESHHNRTGTTKDGGGFDLDGGCTNSIMQYNYSHDNEGAGFLLAQYYGAPVMKGLTIRYNISENDGRKNGYSAIHLWSSGSNGGIQDAHIYNNTVYLSPAASGTPKAVWIQSGSTTIATFRNNLFVTTGGAKLLDAQVTSGIRFEGNNYWSSGIAPTFTWGGSTYNSLETWRTTTGQELRNGIALGFYIDPELTDPGKSITISDPKLLYTLKAYELKKSSELVGKALDLASAFELNPGKTDFWGNSIVQRKDLCIGAHQLTEASKACLYGGIQQLTFGQATGGVYTGKGVTEGANFTPLTAGVGNHSIIYTYTDTQGLSQAQHHTVTVTDAAATTWTGKAGTTNWFDSQNWNNCPPTIYIDTTVPSPEEGVAVFPALKAGEHAYTNNLSAVGPLTIEQDGALSINGNLLAANLKANSLSTIAFSGSDIQSIPGGTYGRLFLNGGGAKKLTGPVTINNSLNLNSTKLYLGAHNLTVEETGNVTEYNSDSYIVTDDSGSLIYKAMGPGITKIFPIGTTLSYTPVTFRNEGIPDNFSTRVEEGFRSEATRTEDGTVNKTWHISEEVAGGSNVNMTLQWNTADELASFTREESYISHYYDQKWNVVTNSVGTLAQGTTADSYSVSLSNLSSFSPFAVASSANAYTIMPVTLSAFTVVQQSENVVLQWETSSEQNNHGFEIETSENGKLFREIGFVESNTVTSNQKQYYTFRDENPGATGTKYYRLRQLDLDGKVTYHFIRAVQFIASVHSLAAYPNPFSDTVTLEIRVQAEQDLFLTVVDPQGKKLIERVVLLHRGLNKLPIFLDKPDQQKFCIVTARFDNKTHYLKLVRR